jgi:hypothetical protein
VAGWEVCLARAFPFLEIHVKPSVVVIVVAALGCGLYLLYETRAAAPPPGSSTARRGPAPSTASVPSPPAIALPARVTPPVVVDDQRAGSTGAQAAEQPTAAGSPVTTDEIRDHIEASFVAAPPAASSDLVQRLESGVRALLPAGSSIRTVQCRGSLCRIETVHLGVDQLRDFVQHAFQDVPRVWNGPAFVSLLDEPTPGTPVVAVAYVGREGTQLPLPGPIARR